MAKLSKVHPSDTDLERRYVGAIKNQRELETLEKHLDDCPPCTRRTKEVERYVKVVRAAFSRLNG
jgi:hypothetical protein